MGESEHLVNKKYNFFVIFLHLFLLTSTKIHIYASSPNFCLNFTQRKPGNLPPIRLPMLRIIFAMPPLLNIFIIFCVSSNCFSRRLTS